MAHHKRTIRGLQDIRTIAGKPDIVNEPYRAYMRITVLEMEKARKDKERESALHRVQNIEERFKEIEAEKDSLLDALGHRNSGNHPGEGRNVEAKPGLGPGKGVFKIRY
jgi:hypothetical protein